MEAPAVAADDMGERHRQVGLALGALALVLLEHDRVEAAAAVVECVEPLAEAGDVLAWREREGEAHTAHPLAVGEHGDAARNDPARVGRRDDGIGCGPPRGGACLEPAGVLGSSVGGAS